MAGGFKRALTLAVRTSDGSNAAAAWELRAGTAAQIVKEISVSLAQATATVLGLGTPAAIGITPTTPASFLNQFNPDVGAGSPPTSTARVAVAWGTGPTVPAAFMRRYGLPAAIGNGFVWKFEDGLVVPANSSIVLWNLAANSLLDVTAVLG